MRTQNFSVGRADGARGMRSLITSVAPCVAPKILDWFHLGMKLRAVKTPIFTQTYIELIEPSS
jgi:hypothetical protein